MKTMKLEDLDLTAAIDLARREPLLLVTSDGQEFLLAEADDFDKEVETLRQSEAFQRFLEQRSRSTRRFSLEDVEEEIDRELASRPEQA
jgi:hypothetical protein